MGAVGLPVFSGFNAGLGALLGPTGGYILGFILCALLYWLLEKKLNHIVLLVLGTAVCYAFGTVWFVNVYSAGGNPISITGALMSCVVPFILPDAAKLALAVAICHRIPTTFPVSDLDI
jgi:biotin transport system substrate-specific component